MWLIRYVLRQLGEGRCLRFYDLLLKKRNGEELSCDEITYIVEGYVRGDIPDYQMSAFCMAVYFQGMTLEETTALTMAMARSGDVLDLSSIPGIKVDKHSTGGVGDKTTLVLAPLVAAEGVPIAKMSGRGLGHTGGTLDKLAAIPGLSTEMPPQQFIEQVKDIGIAVVGQTGDLAPADKKLYALRDVTATVDSIPLIASSIMSKKLAAGADAFVLDVKVGRGAFMSSIDDAKTLAKAMVQIGKGAGKQVVAYLTRMDQPLGCAVGNALEVKEAIETLQGSGPDDLVELCITLGAEMLVLGRKADSLPEAKERVQKSLQTGKAFAKFMEMVKAQGGDPKALEDLSLLPIGDCAVTVEAEENGYVAAVDSLAIGLNSMRLGAGRERKDDEIDLGAGIMLHKKVGDSVRKGEVLATLFCSSQRFNRRKNSLTDIVEDVRRAFRIEHTEPDVQELIIARVEM